MPAALIVGVGLALVAIHVRAPFRWSVAAVVASTFLIPGALFFPGAPPNAFVIRISLWVAVAALIVRVNRGEVPAWSIRPTRVFVALAIFVVVAYVLGVARGPYPSRPEVAFDLWLVILDQLLFLWFATAAVRALGVRAVTTIVVFSVAAASAVAIGERITHDSYAHFWYEGSPSYVIAAQKLEFRGANVRVRGASDFALEFAWVLAYFMPLVALYALRAKRWVAYALPAVVALAFVFTITRSAYAGFGFGAVMLLLTARGDRRILVGLAAAGAIAAVLYLGTGVVRHPYQSADPESEKVRSRRLVLVTQEMADKPWLGVGLDGLIQRGIKGTDSAVLGTYAAVGVVGLTALVGAVGTAAITSVYGAARGNRELAPVAGAVVGGLGAALLGMFAFDSFSAPISGWSIWLLAALGVGLYEEVAAGAGVARPRPLAFDRSRLALPAAGLAVGLGLAVFVPTHVAVDLRFFSLSSHYLTLSKKPNDDYIGRIVVETVCDVGEHAVDPRIKVDCFDPLNFGPGTGVARLEADNRVDLRAAVFRFGGAAKRVPNTRIALTSQAAEDVPTWARTAPVTGLLVGLEAALLLPTFRLRGRRRA